MKAITFLGTTKYKETTYYLGDQVASPTNLFPKVLCEFFRPQQILVMVTKRAKEMWFDELQNQLKPLCLEPTPVEIPEGHAVKDLWEIFGKLTEHLSEKDEVIFDITHSFRTLPLLSFLAASYLRVARNVTIKGIYYGAWEARKPQPPPDNPFSSSPTDHSPVFDLTPFVKLLDWTTATDQFIKTGDAESLSELIQSTDSKQGLNDLALSLNKIALGLNTLRPLSVMEESANLSRKIRAAESEIQSDVPQLIPLLKRIEKDYSQFSLALPRIDLSRTNRTRLTNQLRMVEWYEKRGRWVHALSLARESIVSLVCFLLSKNALSENDREKVEGLIKKYYSGERGVSYKADWQQAIDENLRASLHKLWGGKVNRKHFGLKDSQPDLASLRNDVMHAGQVVTSKPIEQTIQETREILKEFKTIIGKIITQYRQK